MTKEFHYDKDIGRVYPVTLKDEIQGIHENFSDDLIEKVANNTTNWASELSMKHNITIRQVNLIRNWFRKRNYYDTDI